MSHASEYGAFKNNRSNPYAKIAQGAEQTHPAGLDNGHDETPPTHTISLEMGKIGISVIRNDTDGRNIIQNNINPHEAENRADIFARLKQVTSPYIQAARLELPSPEENKRGIFGGIKEPFGKTADSIATIILDGKRRKKVTKFMYEATKEYNRLRYGFTDLEGEPINTVVYFDDDEQIDTIDCHLWINSKTDAFPAELGPIVTLKDSLQWTRGSFNIRFSLAGNELGACITNDSHIQNENAVEALIYNPTTNTFDFKDNATLESLTPSDFTELVEACLKFTPVDNH